MPYATHWVCCRCHYGPMSIENYPSCISCQHRGAKSPCCKHQSLRSRGGSQRISEMPSYYTNICGAELESIAMPMRRPLDHRDDGHYPYRTTPSCMYYCCNCRQGPKIYEHESRCISCNHDVCGNCTYVK